MTSLADNHVHTILLMLFLITANGLLSFTPFRRYLSETGYHFYRDEVSFCCTNKYQKSSQSKWLWYQRENSTKPYCHEKTTMKHNVALIQKRVSVKERGKGWKRSFHRKLQNGKLKYDWSHWFKYQAILAFLQKRSGENKTWKFNAVRSPEHNDSESISSGTYIWNLGETWLVWM